jgi:hypothetical protein
MIFIDIYTSCRALTKIETLENQIRISELLTLEKVQREFVRHRSFYFAEVVYDNNGKFYDLYIKIGQKEISQSQIEKVNNLNKKMEDYINEIEKFLLSSLTKTEHKNENQIKNTKLNINVVEIQDENIEYDLILICGKQYEHFRFFKKDIGIRAEIKDGKIKSIERKSNTLKANSNKENALQHRV